MSWRLTPLLLAFAAACVPAPDTEISCGDGYVDVAEECDPELPASFELACADIDASRRGACDPDTCTLDLRSCFPTCGNGQLDPGEECDPGGGSLPSDDTFEGPGQACIELSPDDAGSPYSGGLARACQSNCQWDRGPCHRCGDGRIQLDEVCDTGHVDFAQVDAFCLSACVAPEADPRPAAVRCSASCAGDCQGFVLDQADPGCCIPNGEPASPFLPCCGFEESGVCTPGLGGG